MLERTEPFTVAEATGAVGGSPMTVKKALDELIEAGRIERLGPVSDWSGRGRAPNAYRVVGGNGRT
jgi:predicted ArsR family transcriptional regulator